MSCHETASVSLASYTISFGYDNEASVDEAELRRMILSAKHLRNKIHSWLFLSQASPMNAKHLLSKQAENETFCLDGYRSVG